MRTPPVLQCAFASCKLSDMRFTPLLLMFAASAVTTKAQAPYSILHVEFVNSTLYSRGYCSPTDRGKDSTKLPTVPGPPFGTALGIADIVSVNGQPVKGTAIASLYLGTVSPTFSPGTPIGDFQMIPAESWDLGFLNIDGTVIGTIHIDGSGSGPAPPGAPKEITAASWTVTGGTGAFFGVRGYFQALQDTISPERRTTDCEDPAYRRINADAGGNKRHPVLYVVPLTQPQIAVASGAPMVYHVDFSPVTSDKPATAGEALIVVASGLGPTRPGVDPGQPFPPFPGNPLQQVNSPVGVTVNGQSASVINAIGWPGLVDTYRVDFRVPDGITFGLAAIQLSAAWIVGPSLSIPIQ
jgi:hypothetical protein